MIRNVAEEGEEGINTGGRKITCRRSVDAIVILKEWTSENVKSAGKRD